MIENIYSHFINSGKAVSTDSRNIIPGSIFFALKGDNFDGNIYAADALSKGASLAVIDNKIYSTNKTILVDNALIALQQLAALYRKRSNFKVLALTGTNGKTTTKELIKVVLSEKYKCSATKGNLNNHIGVPLTILSTPSETEILIVEMGANHIGEIRDLCNIAYPDYGLITNIGKAHLEGFGGFEGVIRAKSEMYKHLMENNKLIFANGEDQLLSELLGPYQPIQKYNDERNSECFVKSLVFENGKLSASISVSKIDYQIKPQLFGKYNLVNIMAAIEIGRYFNVDTQDIIQAIEKYVPENNRSQILKTENNTLILDSYNANPSSMKAALESFSEINSLDKVTILGEMKELGDASYDEHKKIIELATISANNKNLFVGEGFAPFSKNTGLYFNSTNELIEYLKDKNFKGQLIFIKGSRANQLEKIVPYL